MIPKTPSPSVDGANAFRLYRHTNVKPHDERADTLIAPSPRNVQHKLNMIHWLAIGPHKKSEHSCAKNSRMRLAVQELAT